MIRFIIKRRLNDTVSRATQFIHETIDSDCPALEAALVGSTWGVKGYDIREVIGIEVLPAVQTESK